MTAELKYHFTRVSDNRKTGPIPVTTTSRASCPRSCAFYSMGCYALTGPLAWHWAKLDSGRGYDLETLCAYLWTLPRGTLWRHNQAGDLPGDGENIDSLALHSIVRANRGRGFTYTHYPVTESNLQAIRSANVQGFTINLSADNKRHADALAATGLPVVVVIPADAPKVSYTPAGRKIVQCPAENTDRITCANCALCYDDTRSYLIGFKPKGRHPVVIENIAKENQQHG